MDRDTARGQAFQPEDLSRFIVERLNAGDVDGLVALYEMDAVLAVGRGQVASGAREIRAAYEQIVTGRPTVETGVQQAALRCAGTHVVARGCRHGHCGGRTPPARR